MGRLTYRLSAMLVAVVASGQAATAQGQGQGQGQASLPHDIDVRRFGAVGDGRTDCTAAIQKAVDFAAHGTLKTVFVPPGRFLIRRPVFIDAPDVKVAGAGDESVIQVDGNRAGPALVFGVRRAEQDGRLIDADHRPDAFGTLDRVAAPERNRRRGFATRGKVVLMAVSHPAQYGMRSRLTQDGAYDYWGEHRQFTLETCISPEPGVDWTPGAALIGMGEPGPEPGPWYLRVGDDRNVLSFDFKTNDMPDGRDAGDRRILIPLQSTRPPYRLRIWIDFEAGKAGASVNGRSVANAVSDGNNKGRPWKPGLGFFPGRNRFPFLVGAAGESVNLKNGGVTPLLLFGLRLSRVVRGEPADDAAAYLHDDPETVAFLPMDDPPARTIDLASGHAADGSTGVAFLLHTDAFSGGVIGNGVTDLRVLRGSPGVMLGSALRFRAERLTCHGGAVGLGSLPMAASYPVVLRDCMFSGADAGVSLWRAEVWADGLNVERGGKTSVRFHGCSASVDNAMFYFFSPLAETAIDILAGAGWGRYHLRNLIVDNESHGFGRAVLRCEGSSYTYGYLDVDGLDVNQVGKTSALIELEERFRGPGISPPRITARNLNSFQQDQGAVVRVNGPAWFGEVDATLLRNARVEETRPDPARPTGVKIHALRGPP